MMWMRALAEASGPVWSKLDRFAFMGSAIQTEDLVSPLARASEAAQLSRALAPLGYLMVTLSAKFSSEVT